MRRRVISSIYHRASTIPPSFRGLNLTCGRYFLSLSLFYLAGSSKRTLCLEVWNTFLSCIGCVPTTENEQQNTSKEVLGDEQVCVLTKRLSFTHRIEFFIIHLVRVCLMYVSCWDPIGLIML